MPQAFTHQYFITNFIHINLKQTNYSGRSFRKWLGSLHQTITYPWQEETQALGNQKGYEWTKTFMAIDLMKWKGLNM